MIPTPATPDDRRYTVLEHRWAGVHWDFLVEAGSNLQTWAIDEPIRPDTTIPARLLAPHRRLYLDYEGPVAGDRGSVTRWDSGLVRILVWTEDEIRMSVRGAQLLGTVRFWAAGGGGLAEAERCWLFRFGKLS